MPYYYFLKGLEILHQEIRGQVNTIVIKHFNDILFPKTGPANKQHTYHSSNQSIMCRLIKRMGTKRVDNDNNAK